MKIFTKNSQMNDMAVKIDRNLLIADYHLKSSIDHLKLAANRGNTAAENILHIFCMSGLPVQGYVKSN